MMGRRELRVGHYGNSRKFLRHADSFRKNALSLHQGKILAQGLRTGGTTPILTCILTPSLSAKLQP